VFYIPLTPQKNLTDRRPWTKDNPEGTYNVTVQFYKVKLINVQSKGDNQG